jgi:hypothetical protein
MGRGFLLVQKKDFQEPRKEKGLTHSVPDHQELCFVLYKVLEHLLCHHHGQNTPFYSPRN